MRVFIDADACPVVSIVENISKKYNIPVTLLCDTNHVLTSEYSEVIVVGAGADAVDYKLISICHRGDIVVSQDYGVAAMALGKGAFAIHQSGKWYTNDNIDQMLMERHLNKKARRSSHKNHIKGPKKRTEEDDERFAQSFEKMIRMAVGIRNVMKMKKINVTETIVADIQLHIVQNGSGGPVIFWGMYPHQGGEVEHFWEALLELVPEQNFLLVAFQVEDWNRDFSPWEAPAAFGTEAFDGQGARTLKWLLEEGVPYIDRTYHVKEQEHWLAGYSLAGLFALWAAYECDIFSGIACCSGSLWFKDWDIYMREHTLKRKCSVYLSLGGKEEKTKNAVMATVGDRTREQEKLLLEDSFAERVVLEWNPGGHFADSGKRLAKGIKWLMEKRY